MKLTFFKNNASLIHYALKQQLYSYQDHNKAYISYEKMLSHVKTRNKRGFTISLVEEYKRSIELGLP